jgi:hypothetical protein
MLSLAFFYYYAEYRYAECRYAECRYAECHYAECRGTLRRFPLNKMVLVLPTNIRLG